MAIIKLGASVTGIRGTIGGITYSANKSGPYARSWSRGASPRTPTQQTIKQFFVQASQEWATLTPAQKTTWDTFAGQIGQELTNSLGAAYYASGFNWMVNLNTARRWVGLGGLLATPGAATVPATPTLTTISVADPSAGASTVTFPAGTFPTDWAMVLRLSFFDAVGRQAAYQGYKDVVHDHTIGVGTSSWVFTTELQEAFGNVQPGWQYFYQFILQSGRGRKSIAVVGDDVVV